MVTLQVLHLVGTAFPGGVETVVQELVRCADRARIESSVCVLGGEGPIAERLRTLGADVLCLDLLRHRQRGRLRFARRLLRRRFDVLHAHCGSGPLLLLAKLSGARVVQHVHGVPDRWLKEPTIPLVARVFGIPVAAQVVACSTWVARAIGRQMPSLEGRVSVIPNGIDVDRFRPAAVAARDVEAVRAKLGLGSKHCVVGFVGTLTDLKGTRLLLDAAAQIVPQCAEARFVLVGEGPLRGELETRAQRLGPGRVSILPQQLDIRPVMATFDVLCLPSLLEGFGMVSLEAMALGIPVVAFATGGIPEVVDDATTGLLVPSGDTAALGTALLELLRDRERRRAMGIAARARVEALFDARAMSAAVADLYESLRP